jgi:hypothetical protein
VKCFSALANGPPESRDPENMMAFEVVFRSGERDEAAVSVSGRDRRRRDGQQSKRKNRVEYGVRQ